MATGVGGPRSPPVARETLHRCPPVCVRHGRERSLHRKSVSDALIAKGSKADAESCVHDQSTLPMQNYQVPRVKDKRGFDLISDAPLFGRIWDDALNAISNAK